MGQIKELALVDSQIESVDNEVKTFELISEQGLSDQIIEKIMSIPDEKIRQFKYSIAAQSANVKVYRSGEIEVTGAKVQLFMDPVRSK